MSVPLGDLAAQAAQSAQEWTGRVIELTKSDQATQRRDADVRAIDDATEPVFATLEQLLAEPRNLEPPAQVAFKIAYERRTIAIAAKDKLGKTTLVASAASSVTRGAPFCGARTFKGGVLWAGLEEDVSDAVQRFQEFGADPKQVELVIAKPASLRQRIRERIQQRLFVWVIVDSIAEYARIVTENDPPSEGDTSGWSRLIRPLVSISHETGVAMTLLHHERRDGEERGSTELFAAIDGLWNMKGPKGSDDPRTRHFSGRGRRGLDMSSFSVLWNGAGYDHVGASQLSLDARVLIHVEQSPGLSTNKLRQAVGGRAGDVDVVIKELERRGAIRNVGNDGGAKWVMPASSEGVLL